MNFQIVVKKVFRLYVYSVYKGDGRYWKKMLLMLKMMLKEKENERVGITRIKDELKF